MPHSFVDKPMGEIAAALGGPHTDDQKGLGSEVVPENVEIAPIDALRPERDDPHAVEPLPRAKGLCDLQKKGWH
jgi:hypothetical protein